MGGDFSMMAEVSFFWQITDNQSSLIQIKSTIILLYYFLQAAEISHFKSAHNKFFVTDKIGYIGNSFLFLPLLINIEVFKNTLLLLEPVDG